MANFGAIRLAHEPDIAWIIALLRLLKAVEGCWRNCASCLVELGNGCKTLGSRCGKRNRYLLPRVVGANIKAVSERLGHSSIQITLDIYAHVLPEMEQQAAITIGAMLAG